MYPTLPFPVPLCPPQKSITANRPSFDHFVDKRLSLELFWILYCRLRVLGVSPVPRDEARRRRLPDGGHWPRGGGLGRSRRPRPEVRRHPPVRGGPLLRHRGLHEDIQGGRVIIWRRSSIIPVSRSSEWLWAPASCARVARRGTAAPVTAAQLWCSRWSKT